VTVVVVLTSTTVSVFFIYFIDYLIPSFGVLGFWGTIVVFWFSLVLLGSHFRLKHPDGRVTTVPVHNNDDLPKGLFRKIIKEDVQLSFEALDKLTEDKQ